jgi:hypothetical protein
MTSHAAVLLLHPDAEVVRVSYCSAGIAFERAWTAEVYTRDGA